MDTVLNEPAIAYPNFATLDDFLRFAETSLEKWEMKEGNVYAMSHTTKAHSDITYNVNTLLKRKMQLKGCKSFQESIYLKIESKNSLYLPDVVVSCHPEDMSYSNRFIQHPTIIVEVLSESTELNDRTFKWQHYRQLPSLRYYLLVNQKRPFVEVYGRPDAQTLFYYQAFTGTDTIIDLRFLDIELDMAAIYDGVEMEANTDNEFD